MQDRYTYKRATRYVQCDGHQYCFQYNFNYFGDKSNMIESIRCLEQNFLRHIGPIYRKRALKQQNTQFRYHPPQTMAMILRQGHPDGPRDPETLAYRWIQIECETHETKIIFDIVNNY